MQGLNQLGDQARTIWTNADRSQQITLIGAVTTVVLGVVLFGVMLGRADRAVLYAGLNELDAASVKAALDEQAVPYTLEESAGRFTVKVDRASVASTRLSLASAGVPSGGGPGWELFDRSEFGITDFAQKVNFKRALEGELSRTINHMDEVRFSRVQIVIPERRVFARDQVAPSAAVFLAFEPGRSLDRRQVRSIQHLVASSVEGLKANNITITDQSANALAAPSEEFSTAALSASQMEIRAQVERQMQGKVQTLLDRVVGPGRSAVAVTAQIDFDRVERTQETFDPEGQVVRSEQRDTEKNESAEGTGGVVGVTANLPSASTLSSAGGSTPGTSSKSDSTTTNYEISSTVEHIQRAPGSIKSLSVSAVVDGTYVTDAESGEKTYQGRSDEDMARLKTLVAAAVGSGIESTIEVLNVPLDSSVQESELAAATAETSRRRLELGLTVGRYVLVLIIAIVAFTAIRRMVASMAERATQSATLADAVAAGEHVDLTSGEMTESESIAAQLQSMADEQPGNMAALVKNWMVE